MKIWLSQKLKKFYGDTVDQNVYDASETFEIVEIHPLDTMSIRTTQAGNSFFPTFSQQRYGLLKFSHGLQ